MLAAGLLHDTDATGWRAWFDAAGAPEVAVASRAGLRGFQPAARRGARRTGSGALPARHRRATTSRDGRLVQLSDTAIREDFGYYVVAAAEPDAQHTSGLEAFRDWLLATECRAA